MKNDNSFKKYLLFMLCSTAVIFAAVFFFHVSDDKKSTTTIIIDSESKNSTVRIIESTTVKTVTSSRTTATVRKTTSVSTAAVTTAISAEFVRVDINSADIAELIKLKGIGEVLAQEIISYREDSGGFNNIEEIMNVKGIGEGIFADIREHIYVIDPVYPVPDETQEVYEEPEEISTETEYFPALEEVIPIDINTAERDILTLLPHVDEDTANCIIEFRESTGGFKNEYELLLIEGLSRSEVSDIMEYIVIIE